MHSALFPASFNMPLRQSWLLPVLGLELPSKMQRTSCKDYFKSADHREHLQKSCKLQYPLYGCCLTAMAHLIWPCFAPILLCELGIQRSPRALRHQCLVNFCKAWFFRSRLHVLVGTRLSRRTANIMSHEFCAYEDSFVLLPSLTICRKPHEIWPSNAPSWRWYSASCHPAVTWWHYHTVPLAHGSSHSYPPISMSHEVSGLNMEYENQKL